MINTKNPKSLHNYTMMPFFIIGISAFVAGFGWLLAPEPWLLDESANIILLGTSYENLFAEAINEKLIELEDFGGVESVHFTSFMLQ